MSRLSRTATFLAASALAVAAALPAAAATLTETVDFSSNASSPTLVSGAFDSISGSLTANDRDQLAITLAPSATKVTLAFSIADTSYGNNASYTVLYSYSPFITEWYNNSGYTRLADTSIAGVWTSSPSSREHDLFVDLSKGSTLYLSLVSNGAANGGVANYNITGFADAPTASRDTQAPPAVPLPAGVVLLGSALGLGGLAGLRRRKQA